MMYLKRSVIAAVALGCAASCLAQNTAKIETELTLEVGSKYVWHGLNIVNDWVFQPGVSFTAGNLNVSFWGSMELTNWNDPNYDQRPRGRFNEVDMSADYSGTLGPASWTVGVIDYQFPGTGFKRYAEGYATVAFEDLPGSPSLSVYSGLNKISGTYATLGLSHSLPTSMGRVQSVDLGLEINVSDRRCNRFLYSFDSPGATDLHLKVGTEVSLGRAWSIAPTAHYSRLMRSGILAGEPRRDNIWISCAAVVRF